MFVEVGQVKAHDPLGAGDIWQIKNIFESLARRGLPAFAFYVQGSFLSCPR